MSKRDARVKCEENNVIVNINSITVDMMSAIQSELEPYDLISLVFLLYDVPDTALQRLVIFQQITKEIEENNLNLLYDWAIHSQNQLSWKYKFLEALAICQLNMIIRKLGFHLGSVERHFSPNNLHVHVYIHPIKKVLYKLCENMDSKTVLRLKNTLTTYKIDLSDYDPCELIFLKLMCLKFITFDYSDNSNGESNMEELIKIIKYFPELQTMAISLTDITSQLNNKKSSLDNQTSVGSHNQTVSIKSENKLHVDDFVNEFKLIEQIYEEDIEFPNVVPDNLKFFKEAYPIKNTKKIGVCYIINQEKFHLTKESLKFKAQLLDNRLGSLIDKRALEETMSSFNFEVICHENLDRNKMIQSIKDIIQYRVHHDDSMFMICIMSHGEKGHVYASDCLKISIAQIQELCDSDDFKHLQELPKIIILQACQVAKVDPQLKLIADSPSNRYIKKSHFLIFWATAPDYEAYRSEKKGSIFIQLLCKILKKYAKYEHLFDIFTKVNDKVTYVCSKMEDCNQVPIFESTLRKKLYLQIPQ